MFFTLFSPLKQGVMVYYKSFQKAKIINIERKIRVGVDKTIDEKLHNFL